MLVMMVSCIFIKWTAKKKTNSYGIYKKHSKGMFE